MSRTVGALLAIAMLTTAGCAAPQTDWPEITRAQAFRAARASSASSTGSNHDSISVPAGGTVRLATLEGPGMITHCWFTLMTDSKQYLSKVSLQIRWDGAETPAVDAPWGPFFGLGHGEVADVVSAPIVVMAARAPNIDSPPGVAAFQCYFPMPFRKTAEISVVNGDDLPIEALFFHIDYQRRPSVPDDVRYFHASYRTESTTREREPDGGNVTGEGNYVILDTTGEGQYIGCTLHVDARTGEAGKWYEGDDMITVDGEPLAEGILGTGSEDYFGMAWGVRRSFQSTYTGTSYHRWPEGGPQMQQYGRFSLYRWHLPDPIPFRKSIRVTIEHGHNNDAAHRYASVAYWYARAP